MGLNAVHSRAAWQGLKIGCLGVWAAGRVGAGVGAEVTAPVHSSVGGSSDVIPLYSQQPATPDTARNISNLAPTHPWAQRRAKKLAETLAGET